MYVNVFGSISTYSYYSYCSYKLKHFYPYIFIHIYGYGSIPIHTIFSGMNIHLPAILGFTRYQGFDPSPYIYIYLYIYICIYIYLLS